MALTYLEAALLGSLIVEDTELVSEQQFRGDYEELRARGLVRFAYGHVVITTAGERALDAWIEAEREARSQPQPSPSEYAMVMLIAMGITLLVIQICEKLKDTL